MWFGGKVVRRSTRPTEVPGSPIVTLRTAAPSIAPPVVVGPRHPICSLMSDEKRMMVSRWGEAEYLPACSSGRMHHHEVESNRFVRLCLTIGPRHSYGLRGRDRHRQMATFLGDSSEEQPNMPGLNAGDAPPTRALNKSGNNVQAKGERVGMGPSMLN